MFQMRSAGSIKKWVDAEGNVHFGDAPPAAQKTEDVDININKGTGGTTAPGLRPDEQLMLDKYEKRYERSYAPEPSNSLNHYDESRCEYYKLRLKRYQRKAKSGYKQSEKQTIKERIAWYEMKVSDYCK